MSVLAHVLCTETLYPDSRWSEMTLVTEQRFLYIILIIKFSLLSPHTAIYVESIYTEQLQDTILIVWNQN